MGETRPALSVVVPVHQGRAHLRRVLLALTKSDLPRDRWELIVVDDASTDGSAEIAAEHADLVVRLGGAPRGPAYARNRGVDISRGRLVAFVDADVLVHPGALSRLVHAMEDDASVGAVIGAYDAQRTSGSVLSEYRNLLRHVEHRSSVGETDCFAAGFAVVRRSAFLSAGAFDEWRYPRPQAEALELGDRLRALGYRLVRRGDITATHLRRWTLRDWIGVDLLDRGTSASRLARASETRARAGRLYLASAADSIVAWLVAALLVAAVWQGRAAPGVLATVCLATFVLHRIELFVAFARARGTGFALAAVPLHLTTCAVYGIASAIGWLLYHLVGEPQPDAVTQAFAEVGVRTWPPVPASPAIRRPAAERVRISGGGPRR